MPMYGAFTDTIRNRCNGSQMGRPDEHVVKEREFLKDVQQVFLSAR